jgi:outer membrane protein assembly factor BamB
MRWCIQLGAILGFVLVLSVRAEEWPGWRGPRGDGTSQDSKVPLRWSKTENVRWKTEIPGKGHSSPIVWGDWIFVSTCLETGGKRMLLCLDRRSGKILWQRIVLKARLEPKHELNSYASSTPATDGKRVWVPFLDEIHVRLACYDLEGNLLWIKTPGEFHSKHGFCSCPVLYKDMVILNCDQDAAGYLVALDKETGAERWRINRPNQTRSYCTPLIVDAAGKRQMVLTGSKCVASYDPDTGKLHWILDGPTEQFVASMVYGDGVFFLTAGYPTYHLLAIRPDGQGNVTKTHVLWHATKGAGYVPSPVAFGKWFFVVSDTGIASCLEARTGKRHWMERLGQHHSGSPILARGHLFFIDDAGTTFVVKPGEKFELVNKNSLEEECYASPAAAHGQLFIRTLHHLWCIEEKQGQLRSQ